jgi:hypothetical protein
MTPVLERANLARFANCTIAGSGRRARVPALRAIVRFCRRRSKMGVVSSPPDHLTPPGQRRSEAMSIHRNLRGKVDKLFLWPMFLIFRRW